MIIIHFRLLCVTYNVNVNNVTSTSRTHMNKHTDIHMTGTLRVMTCLAHILDCTYVLGGVWGPDNIVFNVCVCLEIA